jgi:hypothetical protein
MEATAAVLRAISVLLGHGHEHPGSPVVAVIVRLLAISPVIALGVDVGAQ